ncbi:MAG TPA: tripartite tricarboxylate transporter substrate binding protein, partial [Burkholderiales bacterium]|nr:tripartite tricarboxylate transporter substrate binding protein [Burkholderiales bacterium]
TVGVGVMTSLGVCSVWAQSAVEYPVKPVRVIVGQAPGGGTDIQTRIFAQKLSEAFGRAFVVENRTGAGSLVSYRTVAGATPDGYTLLAVSGGYTIAPAVYQNLGYDPVKDLAPISLVVQAPFLLMVHPSLPVKNVKELVALAKSQPGALTYASAGHGSSTHLAFALFTTLAGLNITHVPYKGTGPALIDTMSGQVHMLIGNVLSSLQHAKSGKLRALAVTTAKRSPAVPDLPTLAESGVSRYESSTWHGWFAPAGTSQAIVAKLNAELAKSTKAADVISRLAPDGGEPVGSSPEELRQFIINDIARWRKVVKDAGIKLD